MKVRNTTSRQMLVPGQKFVRPGPDLVRVKDSEAVQFLVSAGALEVASEDEETYDEMTVEELQAEAAGRELHVEGTGADGNVLKADLVAALHADDNTKETG
jgi:hypothetical protein